MIELRGINKSFGENAVLQDLNLKVRPSETLVLLGLSGSGKTTTLRTMNGLVPPDSGQVLIMDQALDASNTLNLRRQMGYVIQKSGLFPHLSVYDNIAVVPRLLKWSEERIKKRVNTLLTKLHLPQSTSNSMPAALSGGQQQRVGLARALAASPPILLMDEPFGGLDPITRKAIRTEFLELDELKQTTTVLVTHDVQEAFEMGDRIALMKNGRIEEIASPQALVESHNTFVSEFLAGDEFLLTLKAKGLYRGLSDQQQLGKLDWSLLEKLSRHE